MRTLKNILCYFICMTLICGCGISAVAADDTGGTENGVYTNYKHITMYVGDTQYLKGFVLSDLGKIVSFESDAPEIASIDENGEVKGNAVGTAHIIVSDSGCSERVNVMVLPEITKGVKLSKTGIVLAQNQSEKLNFEVIGADADSEVVWESSNESAVSVSGNGTVTALKNNTTAVIYARLANDSETQVSQCTVMTGFANAGGIPKEENTAFSLWQCMYTEKDKDDWKLYDLKTNDSDGNAIWYTENTGYGKGLVSKNYQMPGDGYDTARVFNAIADGKVKIQLNPYDANANISVSSNTKVNFKITQNDKKIYPLEEDWLCLDGSSEETRKSALFDGFDDKAMYLDVKKGDTIKFITSTPQGENKARMNLYWEGFWISYTDDTVYSSLTFENDVDTVDIGNEYKPIVSSEPQGMETEYLSDNPNIISIVNGKITAAAEGNANLYVYNKAYKLADKMLLQVAEEPKDDADIKQTTIGTLDDETSRINSIPKETTVDSMKAAISIRGNASMEIYQQDGTAADGKIENGYKCIVTSADGTVQREYTLYLVSETVLNRSYNAIECGESFILRAAAVPDNDEKIVFSSSDSDIAAVEQDGRVSAVSPGIALISAQSGESIKSCVVEVIESVTKGVKFDKLGIAFPSATGSQSLNVIKVGVSDDSEIVWSSSNESVATVSDGVVNANGKGTAYITAMIKGDDSASKAKCRVMVGTITADSEFSSTSNTNEDIWQYMYAPKDTVGQWKLMETAKNSGDDNNVFWHKEGSEDWSKIGFVRKVTQAAGREYDTARVFNAPAAGKLKIKLPDDAGASLSVASDGGVYFRVLKNDEQIFPADNGKLLLEKGSKNRVFDALENQALYTEVERGDKIKLVLEYYDNITTVYTYYGGYNISYVSESSVSGIKLDKESAELKEGEITTVTAESLGGSLPVTYRTSDADIATVDLNGHIKALKEGKCKIYAYTKDDTIADFCDVTVKPADLKIGKPQVSLIGTDVVTARVNVICNMGADVHVTLICVLRDENGKAKAITVSDESVLKTGDNVEIRCDTQIDSIIKKADVYIWDSIEGLHPLAANCSYDFPLY